VSITRIKTDGHEVVFGRYCLAELAECLSAETYRGVKIFILTDENTSLRCLPILISKIPALAEAEVVEVEPGEASKSVEVASRIWEVLSELGADRASVMINLGGGVISDLGGFVAGTFKRGIRFFNVPTTLLAQVDASVGGKTGINHSGLKNEVGIFKNPNGVFVDPEFLSTLPKNQILSGFAEMIKHALVYSKSYWEELKDVGLMELETLDDRISRSIQIKNEIVGSDPYESGRRKILNFGHTIGHALESFSQESDVKTLLHGEAIAVGMVCESFISTRVMGMHENDLEEITSFIFSLFAKIDLEPFSYHRIIELMRHDKKNRDGRIRFSLLTRIGDAEYDCEIHADRIVESINYYRRWVG
jgi:3-dehydroquinate synthase